MAALVLGSECVPWSDDRRTIVAPHSSIRRAYCRVLRVTSGRCDRGKTGTSFGKAERLPLDAGPERRQFRWPPNLTPQGAPIQCDQATILKMKGCRAPMMPRLWT